MKRNERGITLIALVVTIVVLLILAGVSISMLTGENGIVNQASNAKDATEQARVEELVDLAVNSLIGENQGSTSGITPEMVAEEVNEMENRDDIYTEGSTFPTNIIFPEEGRKVDVNLMQKNELEGIYSENINKEDIAPIDLFDFEIINPSEKTVKILRIKPKYCNVQGYNPETQTEDLIDTNYEIKYTGITDTLIIPYQIDGKYVLNGIEGEIYTITEVDLTMAQRNINGGCSYYTNFPNIETIIYPNTVVKIYSADRAGDNCPLKKVVLSESLKEIPSGFFAYAEKLTSINIPNSIINIGGGAFEFCTGLTSINIPSSVTNIGDVAFGHCTGLTNITIPDNVINMGYNVFSGWGFEQTINVSFKEEETPEGWRERWNANCKATINYLK